MSELKKCPFCSGEAKLIYFGAAHIPFYKISCAECGCTQADSIHKEAVINAWNTRKPMANIVEKLEEREKYLENAMKENHKKGHSFSEEKAMNERVATRYAINIVKQEINKGSE